MILPLYAAGLLMGGGGLAEPEVQTEPALVLELAARTGPLSATLPARTEGVRVSLPSRTGLRVTLPGRVIPS